LHATFFPHRRLYLPSPTGSRWKFVHPYLGCPQQLDFSLLVAGPGVRVAYGRFCADVLRSFFFFVSLRDWFFFGSMPMASAGPAGFLFFLWATPVVQSRPAPPRIPNVFFVVVLAPVLLPSRLLNRVSRLRFTTSRPPKTRPARTSRTDPDEGAPLVIARPAPSATLNGRRIHSPHALLSHQSGDLELPVYPFSG